MSDRIGKYRLIAQLGHGGMATVFLSVVPGPAGVNKLLVVKVLREDLSQDADFVAMFVNEGRIAARLNHANVVHTYEVGFEDGRYFLAMDFLDGQPLHSILRKASREGMPLEIHIRILADALSGLDYAHTLTDYSGTPLCVVHRDVSPQNVFVTYDGQVKVVDFGIAKAAGVAQTTQAGVFKGKLAYVAPEQARGAPVDARADIFSVGVMLWEAIAKRRFAQGESETAVLARRLAGTEPRIRSVVPDADPELAAICDRAMAFEPEDRYPSARAFQDALEGYLDRFSRRIGRREIADLASRLFEEQRGRVRAVIDEELKRVLRESSSMLPVPVIESNPGAMLDPSRPTTVERGAQQRHVITAPIPRLPTTSDIPPASGSATPGTLAAAHISPATAPQSAKSRALVALGAVAVGAIAAVAFVFAIKKPHADVGTSSSATPADARERVELRVEFGPASATAKLDGVPLASSPFVARVDRDGSIHRIEVDAPGFAPKTTMVSYDKDVSLSIVLVPEAATADSVAPALPVSALPSVAASGAPASHKAPPRPSDSSKPPKSVREIDEADPYKQK